MVHALIEGGGCGITLDTRQPFFGISDITAMYYEVDIPVEALVVSNKLYH